MIRLPGCAAAAARASGPLPDHAGRRHPGSARSASRAPRRGRNGLRAACRGFWRGGAPSPPARAAWAAVASVLPSSMTSTLGPTARALAATAAMEPSALYAGMRISVPLSSREGVRVHCWISRYHVTVTAKSRPAATCRGCASSAGLSARSSAAAAALTAIASAAKAITWPSRSFCTTFKSGCRRYMRKLGT